MADTMPAADRNRAHRPANGRHPSRLPIAPLGMSLAVFLAITFVICVAFGLLFPDQQMYRAWAPFLPGFTWISWPSFFLGLVESFAYGWYIALIFGPLFNLFSTRWHR